VQRVAVRCFVRVSTPVLVTAETVRRGESLGAVNVERRRTDITTFRYDPLTELSSLEDSRAVRTLAPGTILHERCIEKPPLVRRDEMVYVTTRKGNIRVSVQARARESGGLGDHIWVQNLASRTLLRVKICGKGRVKVETGEAI
jgi:flagella basal body P-ring formation protein FlgA